MWILGLIRLSLEQARSRSLSDPHKGVLYSADTIFSVYGAVTGKQRGRLLEVTNSFELMYDMVEGHVVIDREYLRAREAQCKLTLSYVILFGKLTVSDFR